MSLKCEALENPNQNLIPKGWHKISLGQLATFHRGYDLPHKDMIEGQYPVVGSNGIIGYHNNFKTKGPGVAIGRSGNLGKPFFVDKDYWPHNTSLYISDFHNSDPVFVYYFLKTLYLGEYNAGSAVPTLNRNHIHTIGVLVPENTKEQKAIGKVLANLDEKIGLNQRMNQTLEAVGAALFRRWFVDFEFPNQEGKPYRSTGGKMVESELGKIPNNWSISTLASMSDIVLGGTPKRAESRYWGGDILWATAGAIASSTDLYILNTEKKITQEGVSNSNAKVLPPETIIVTARGTVGEIRLLGVPSSVNQTCYALSPKDGKSTFFLYYLLKTSIERIKSLSYGTVFETITMKTFNECSVINPGIEVIKSFSEFIAPFFYRIKLNSQENEVLSQYRDNLLPKLMSGKIRVPINKENVEMAVT